MGEQPNWERSDRPPDFIGGLALLVAITLGVVVLARVL